MQDIVAQPLQQSNYWGFGYKIDFTNPCAQSYINSVADQFAEWGVDFLKLDSVTPGSGIIRPIDGYPGQCQGMVRGACAA